MNPILMPPFLLNFTLTIVRIYSVTSEASTEGSTICRITSSSIVSATYAGLTMLCQMTEVLQSGMAYIHFNSITKVVEFL